MAVRLQRSSFSFARMAHVAHLTKDALTAPRSRPEAASQDDAVASDATTCVICLEIVSEPAVALPCKHDCFDFPCLGNWLTKHKTCPLCKADVEKLEYEFNGAGEPRIFFPPSLDPDGVSLSGPTHSSDQRQYPERQMRRSLGTQEGWSSSRQRDDLGLERRRHIYRNRLLSLHVGSNRLSGYQELNPQRFRDDDVLLSRARKWIRRELRVFDFLKSECGSTRAERPRANNAEFLLEYIIAVLRSTDIRGSGGHAEDLLKDFLGRENTRIFLHELQAWLRSPYSLDEWDRAVQYDESQGRRVHPISGLESSKGAAPASLYHSSSLQRLQDSQDHRSV